METEMDLTLEELDEYIFGCYRERENELLPKIIAAARAHLKNQELARGFMARRSQPPQQREDDGTGVNRKSDSGDNCRHHNPDPDLDSVAPAPSSTVERWPENQINEDGSIKPWPSPDTNFSKRKSEDAGLVERLRSFDWDDPQDQEIGLEAAAALEAKDAEIAEQREAIRNMVAKNTEAQAEIERLRESLRIECRLRSATDKIAGDRFLTIERLREALKETAVAIAGGRDKDAQRIARAALKGGGWA
jgi:hypothetical protein